MKTYEVNLPITGFALLEVEAESEADAISEAFEKANFSDVFEWGFETQGAYASTLDEDED